MEDIQSYWDKEREVYAKISDQGMASYIRELPGMDQAFAIKDRSIRCMDEGTPGGLHIAGSGILMSEEELRSYIEKAKPDGAYSHGSCGACGIYAKQAHTHEDCPDDCGPEWCKRMEEMTGIRYLGHIAKEEMNRPADAHIARCAYYDGRGDFDYSLVNGLPAGFIISRAFMTADYALKEAEIACQIAMGGHGYGSLISADEPFYLFVIAKDGEGLAGLKTELHSIVDRFEGRVIVDGFIA